MYDISTMHAPSLSVIIPIGPGEHAWVDLVQDLVDLPSGTEIIFSTIRQYSGMRHAPTLAKLKHKKVEWEIAHPGRAHLMNAGAKRATHEYLWFLHADTRLSKNCVHALLKKLKTHPSSLLYADLEYPNQPFYFSINKFGAFIRSRFCRIAIGQQGLCIAASNFNRIGGFSITPTNEEDFFFCANALKQNISLHPIGAYVSTRIRSYSNYGWFRHTIKRILLSLHYAPAAGWLSFLNRFK